VGKLKDINLPTSINKRFIIPNRGKKHMSAPNTAVPNFNSLVTQFAQIANLTHTPGRVYDKVHAVNESGRYMVERKTGGIYGIKSWNQHNPRRLYGTLDTVDQWDWSVFPAVPVAGTISETLHNAREATFVVTYKKRGRPLGAKNKVRVLSSSVKVLSSPTTQNSP
jgi:hypothetical protein